MIVRGSDTEAELLERCLSSVSPYVDGIFITITQPNENVEKVAKNFKAHVSHFEWIGDFAAARNFNFSQVPKEFDYILWTDADDVWRGLDKLKPTLDDNPRMDAFAFDYLYDWDEAKLPTVVHKKTMLIRNDNCASWVGALHEDLIENRQLDVRHIKGIERLHLTTSERVAENSQRNVTIAKSEIAKNSSDPRTYWNLANSQFAVSNFVEARDTFEQFLTLTESDDERYLAYERLGDTYRALGNTNEAIKQLRLAIGLFPYYPEAYFQLAHLYFTMGNWDKAEEYCIQGLRRKPLVNKMIVYNPRDYDYNPMMLLANVYYQKNRPDLMLPLLEGCSKIYPKDKRLKDMVKEGRAEKKAMGRALTAIEKLRTITDKVKLKKAIEALPEAIASHPALVSLRNTNFIKETSTGKDLVIYCGNTLQEWNPELFKTKGFGGSEEAVVNLSRELAKLGWNVTVYNNCGHKPMTEIVGWPTSKEASIFKNISGTLPEVTYRPFWEWNYRDKQDVVILWRWAKPLDAEINAPKIFLDLHDVVSEGEFTPARLKRVTKILVKTAFHRSLFPNVPEEKIAIVPNGMDFALLESNPPIEKDPFLIINTSSPDRSMDVLPKLFKEVKKRVPQARLQWAYGWDNFKAANANDMKKLEWMKQTQKEMDEVGIETLGRISQAEVGKLYQRATILAYPSAFAEIFCISVLKAQSAHCLPITTDFGAFAEINKFGIQTHTATTKENWNKPYQYFFGITDEKEQQAWVDAVCKSLKDGGSPAYPPAVREWTDTFKWPEVAKHWNDLLCD